MAYKVVISQALPIKLFKFESYLFVFIRLATMVTTKKGDSVTFFDKCANLHIYVTFTDILCYYALQVIEITSFKTASTHLIDKEIDMSKVLEQVRLIAEATIVSVVLVLAALAVPAVILYAAI